MKNSIRRIFPFTLAVSLILIAKGFAQGESPLPKGPVSKVYLAETKGVTQIQNGEKIFPARQSTAFDAPGTIIETKPNSHSALVFSNGTGLLVEQNTRVEISRFAQEPFLTNRTTKLTTGDEPSVSQSVIQVNFGSIALCTNRLISGSSMHYHTPQAAINLRGGRVVIAIAKDETIVDLLEGDLTIRAGDRDAGGQILQPGERAVIRSGSTGQDPQITILPTPATAMAANDRRVGIACNSRKSVTFEMIAAKAAADPTQSDDEAAGEAAGADQQIVAQPTVPANPPSNIVISPDRLPGT